MKQMMQRTTAMRDMFDSVNMAGTVVIGEGELDEAPMLYIGEELGTGNGPEVDIAVDPLEGTNIVAKGLANAMAVIAIADKGTFFMLLICTWKNRGWCTGKISLDDPIEKQLKL